MNDAFDNSKDDKAMAEKLTAMRFRVNVSHGLHSAGSIDGIRNIPAHSITLADLNKIHETEEFLEKLTGYRWHIGQRHEG